MRSTIIGHVTKYQPQCDYCNWTGAEFTNHAEADESAEHHEKKLSHSVEMENYYARMETVGQ